MLLDKLEKHLYFPTLFIPVRYKISILIYNISYETNWLSTLIGFDAFDIENNINLKITSPDNFLTCVSTLVSTDSSSNISFGISPMSSFAVITQN